MRVLGLLVLFLNVGSIAYASETMNFESVRLGLGSRNKTRRDMALTKLEGWAKGLCDADKAVTQASRQHASRRFATLQGALALCLRDRRVGIKAKCRIASLAAQLPINASWRMWSDLLASYLATSPSVLEAAIKGCAARRNDMEFLKHLMGLIYQKDRAMPVRALAFEALGHLRGAVPMQELARPRRDAPWLIQAACARGLGHRRDLARVPALLRMLKSTNKAVQVQAWESLIRVTRQSLALDVALWDAWWAKRSASFRGPKVIAKKQGDVGRYATPVPLHIPHYYGIPIPRKDSGVVFCLDVSQSMYGFGIAAARRELRATLLDLPTSHRFQIVAFHGNLMPWKDGLVAAHPLQKYLAIQWMEALETTAYTNIFDAAELAFGYAGRGRKAVAKPVRVDEIFLLTDGAPNRGAYRAHKLIVKYLKAMSVQEGELTIPIHAVAAGEAVYDLLRDIAKATGGSFVDAFE